jgi:hypothetical protein
LFPLAVIQRSVRALVDARQPVVIYSHPYEFNPSELSEYAGKVSPWYRLHQGFGRRGYAAKLGKLFGEFRFGRFDETIKPFRIP